MTTLPNVPGTTSVEGTTVTIRETDPTASTSDAEPVTQSTPDLFIYEPAQPHPAAEADADAEVESEDQDDLTTHAETESAESESQADADVEVESEVDDDVDQIDETESEAATDTQPEHNGDGQAEPDPEGELPEGPATQFAATDGDPEALDLQHDAEVLDAPADRATEGRPYLSDGGVFEERWNAIQIGFVDDPRSAVESADHLVTEAIDDLAKILVNQRELLQAQWRQDDHVDTEQLRVVFRDYRALLLGLVHT